VISSDPVCASVVWVSSAMRRARFSLATARASAAAPRIYMTTMTALIET